MKKVLFLGGVHHGQVHIISQFEELYTNVCNHYSQTYGGSNGFAIFTHKDTVGGEHVKMTVELVEEAELRIKKQIECNTLRFVDQRHAVHTLKLKNHDLKEELETARKRLKLAFTVISDDSYNLIEERNQLKTELETVSVENAELRQKVHELEIQRDAAVLTLTSGS